MRFSILIISCVQHRQRLQRANRNSKSSLKCAEEYIKNWIKNNSNISFEEAESLIKSIK